VRQTCLIIFVLLGICIIVGCGVKRTKISVGDTSKTDISPLLSKIGGLGYYKYIGPSQIEDVKKKSLSAGYIFGWEDSGRDFTADAENLAEGGIAEFYNTIESFLLRQNVNIMISSDFSENGYSVKVNDKYYVIYNKDELESKDIWELSTIRCFSIVNVLLKEVNSNERLYTLYGGNDLRAVFLTDEIYNAIIDAEILPEKELPKLVPDIF
jgi:hypothetical protein